MLFLEESSNSSILSMVDAGDADFLWLVMGKLSFILCFIRSGCLGPIVLLSGDGIVLLISIAVFCCLFYFNLILLFRAG